MRLHQKILLITSVFFFSSNSFAAEGIWASEIESVLQKNGLDKNQYGIEIRSADGSQTYFSSNTNQSFNPASTIKILVAIVALEKLGPHYKFSTLVKKNGKDLCLVGQGDPSLVYEDLFLLSEQLLREPTFNKKEVGQIFVDENHFPTILQYGDDFDGDAQRSFTAPLSSLSLNYNSVTIFVKPGKVGGKAEVYTEPRSNYFVIKNQTKTISSGEKMIDVRVDNKEDKVEITAIGKISPSDKETLVYRAVTNPSIYAGSIFKDLLQRANVTVTGNVQKKNCGPEFQEVARFQSKPLSQIILGMNKFSNNFIAEMLTYHVGSEHTSKSGMDEVLHWAKSKKLPMTKVHIENASGLSRNNSVTPIFLWNLLAYGHRNFETYPEFISSFPLSGLDGTLRRRFHSPSTKGLIRAKSGSLKNTVSLVGTIETVKRGEILFVFLFDTGGKSTSQIQSIEEKILEKVAALAQN